LDIPRVPVKASPEVGVGHAVAPKVVSVTVAELPAVTVTARPESEQVPPPYVKLTELTAALAVPVFCAVMVFPTWVLVLVDRNT